MGPTYFLFEKTYKSKHTNEPTKMELSNLNDKHPTKI